MKTNRGSYLVGVLIGIINYNIRGGKARLICHLFNLTSAMWTDNRFFCYFLAAFLTKLSFNLGPHVVVLYIHILSSLKLSNPLEIYQYGIYLLYRIGIILSRGFTIFSEEFL